MPCARSKDAAPPLARRADGPAEGGGQGPGAPLSISRRSLACAPRPWGFSVSHFLRWHLDTSRSCVRVQRRAPVSPRVSALVGEAVCTCTRAGCDVIQSTRAIFEDDLRKASHSARPGGRQPGLSGRPLPYLSARVREWLRQRIAPFAGRTTSDCESQLCKECHDAIPRAIANVGARAALSE